MRKTVTALLSMVFLPYNIRFKAYICEKLSKKQEKSKHFLACASFEQNEPAGEC